jgi:drug/metabolite transporter (DMT)-like permease
MRLRGFVSVGTTACLFGLGVVLAKALTQVINPVLLACIALGGGGLLIALVLLLTRHTLLPRLSFAGWGALLLLAVVGTAAPLLLVITGFASTSAVASGVLIQAQGPAAVLFAALWLHERPTRIQLLGTVLVVLGSVLVVWRPGMPEVFMGSGQTDLGGPLLILAGALGYGFALIPAKLLTGHADALQVSALRLALGAIVVMPLVFVQPALIAGGVSWDVGEVVGTVALTALYVVTNYDLGYVLQQDGLRFLKAWEAGVVLQTIPLFTALFAILFFHETLSPLDIVGGCCVITGGVIVAGGGRHGTAAIGA